MIRFTVPDPALPLPEQISQLRRQFDAFLHAPALQELFVLLHTDRHTIGKLYNGRQMPDGTVRETQELEPAAKLEGCRTELYPLLRELGFFTINRPLDREHSHILVLGGSLEACYTRTVCASAWMTPSVRYVDGLSCFRPIHPRERRQSSFCACCDTEFGAMSESFSEVFQLPPKTEEDAFCGDRNLNRISCVRSFSGPEQLPCYRIFAAPSTQPELRRADTGDCFLFYLKQAKILPSDSLLILTNNRYCNRQFLQIVYLMMQQKYPVRFDVIGCTPEERIPGCERYDPFQFLQDLIGVLDWIDRFNREL